MKSKILKTIHQFNMLSKGDRVLVAFSGGADSVTLLHFLAMNAHELGITVSAAHVNHMLRGDESDRDEQFCYDFCDALNVPLYIKSVDINALSKKQKLSHETCARNVRYDFFGQITAGADNYMIATAHTLSDCCETLLLNLARGSSMTGLRSIPPRRGKIIRPLIECTREEIEDYIAQNGLRYVTDSTNLTDEYTRNIIRHNIIPVLHEINRGAEYSIGRAISSVRRDEEYLDLLSETAFSDCRRDGGFDAEALSRLPDSLRFRVIKKLLSQSGFELSYELILSVDRAIKENKSANLPLGKKLFCAGGAIVISDQKKTSPQKTGECLALSPGSPVRIAGKQIYISVSNADNSRKEQIIYKKFVNNHFDYDMIKGNLYVRTRRNGDRFRPANRNVTKSLKKLFNEMKTDPFQRDSLLLLCDDDGIVFIEGAGCCESVKPTEKTKNLCEIKINAISD